jgi:glycosyltransferase involved in cell wall biosynthesis
MNKENKILIIIPSLTLGGAEKQALEYAKSLKRLGYRPIILGLGKEGGMINKLKELEMEYKTYSFKGFFKAKKIKQLFFLLKFIFFVRSLNCKTGISFTYWPNVIFKLIHPFCGIKKMYWNQRSVDSISQPIFWERLSKNIKVNYIANSFASAGCIAKKHSVSKNDIQVIFNVMDLSSSTIINQEKNKIDIIMVANFFEEKDHFTLIKAFKKVVIQNVSLDLKLHLVGTAPGGSERYIEAKAKAFDLGLSEWVIFHGAVMDVKMILKQMDIGVLSTYSEGFSNAIMEYMDAGLPVVASAIGSNLEALTDLNKEFLFEVENVNELANKLELFILDENLRREKGIKNREIAQNSFHIHKLDEALRQLLIK